MTRKVIKWSNIQKKIREWDSAADFNIPLDSQELEYMSSNLDEFILPYEKRVRELEKQLRDIKVYLEIFEPNYRNWKRKNI